MSSRKEKLHGFITTLLTITTRKPLTGAKIYNNLFFIYVNSYREHHTSDRRHYSAGRHFYRHPVSKSQTGATQHHSVFI